MILCHSGGGEGNHILQFLHRGCFFIRIQPEVCYATLLHPHIPSTIKKTISLNHPKKTYPRMVEAAKYEVRKYIKRERKRELPKGVDFWDFDCRFGDTEQEAEPVHLSEINKRIDEVASLERESFYVEVLRKEGVRMKREKKEEEQG